MPPPINYYQYSKKQIKTKIIYKLNNNSSLSLSFAFNTLVYVFSMAHLSVKMSTALHSFFFFSLKLDCKPSEYVRGWCAFIMHIVFFTVFDTSRQCDKILPNINIEFKFSETLCSFIDAVTYWVFPQINRMAHFK